MIGSSISGLGLAAGTSRAGHARARGCWRRAGCPRPRHECKLVARHGAAGPGDPCRRTVSAWEPMRVWSAPGTGSATRPVLHLRGQSLRLRCGCCGVASCIAAAAPPAPRVLAPVGSASANAQGGTISMGDIKKGATPAWRHQRRQHPGGVRVSGGTNQHLSRPPPGWNGDRRCQWWGLQRERGRHKGSGGNGGSTYAGPGDPCWSGVQCVAADTVTCHYNAYTDDYRCVSRGPLRLGRRLLRLVELQRQRLLHQLALGAPSILPRSRGRWTSSDSTPGPGRSHDLARRRRLVRALVGGGALLQISLSAERGWGESNCSGAEDVDEERRRRGNGIDVRRESAAPRPITSRS